MWVHLNRVKLSHLGCVELPDRRWDEAEDAGDGPTGRCSPDPDDYESCQSGDECEETLLQLPNTQPKYNLRSREIYCTSFSDSGDITSSLLENWKEGVVAGAEAPGVLCGNRRDEILLRLLRVHLCALGSCGICAFRWLVPDEEPPAATMPSRGGS